MAFGVGIHVLWTLFLVSTKNIHEFQILTSEIFYETLTNNVVSFEQLGPGVFSGRIIFAQSFLVKR